jgi:hypothetical protein
LIDEVLRGRSEQSGIVTEIAQTVVTSDAQEATVHTGHMVMVNSQHPAGLARLAADRAEAALICLHLAILEQSDAVLR